MKWTETLKMAARSTKDHGLRSLLTMTIIAIGITSLVGILTAIDVFIYTMGDQLSSLGADAYTIEPIGHNIRRPDQPKGDPITYRQALEFKNRITDYGIASVSSRAPRLVTVKHDNKKSDPNVTVLGHDENYIDLYGRELTVGRNFNKKEILDGHRKCIIGMDVVDILFEGEAQRAMNQVILADQKKYQVIGVFKKQGSTMNQNSERMIVIPVTTLHHLYGQASSNYNLSIHVRDPQLMDASIDHSIGVMRALRKIPLGHDEDFKIAKSEGMIDLLRANTASIRLAAMVIGLLTILGAAIGLMNIMLVSVTERTKEIGIAKALGANQRHIGMQFMLEACMICLLGGLAGVILGIAMGNVINLFLGGTFIIPWNWIFLGLSTCLIVGLVAGIYPAQKAAKLDPIESLRFE